jgi:hypothetical protein
MKRAWAAAALVGVLGCNGRSATPVGKDGGAGGGGAVTGAGGSGGSGTGGSAGMGMGGSAGAGDGGAAGGAGGSASVDAGAGGSIGGAGGTGGCTVTLHGVVRDPAGRVPVYNVVVHVPSLSADVGEGHACLSCLTISPPPVTWTLTDASGAFTLPGVPTGAAVPLVMQIGKWQRQISVAVPACGDMTITDANLTRLPRDHTEGHLPLIAVVTGHADAVDCMLRNVGIADSEFTSDTGGGRVHMYVGGGGMVSAEGAAGLASGATFAEAYTTLFANPTKLAQYDHVLLACEGEQLESSKSPYYANIKAYADGGGRLFVEHLQSPWIRRGPAPWPSTAMWIGVGPDPTSPITGIVDTSQPKGAALADWLMGIGASTTRGQFPITMPQNSVDGPVTDGTTAWVTTQMPATIQVLTFDTPLETPAAGRCGRVDFGDIHIGDGAGSSHPDVPFPAGCTTSPSITAAQDLWEFMLFDVPTCVEPDIGP